MSANEALYLWLESEPEIFKIRPDKQSDNANLIASYRVGIFKSSAVFSSCYTGEKHKSRRKPH